MPALRRAYTDCRFGQLHYLAGGEPSDRPTLVFLHQNPSSFVEYRPLIEAMARDRRVVAFDTPGNGMSDRPPAPQSIDAYAAAFADGLDQLGVAGPIDLFGFHTGALLSMELGLQRPDLIGRLVLSGIPMRTLSEREAILTQIRATPEPTDDGDKIFERLRWLWNFTVAERLPGVSMERAAAVFAEKAKPLHRYWWVYDGVWTYPVAERLPLIRQPVLVLQPHEILLENSRAAAGMIPDCRFVEMPQLTRDVFDVGAGDFAQAMRAFLI